VAQILEVHTTAVRTILSSPKASAGLKDLVRAEVRDGAALAFRGVDRTTADGPAIQSTLTAQGATYRLDGTKAYSTGAFAARWLFVIARLDETRLGAALVHRASSGVDVTDDWDGIGQRSTGSGNTVLRSVDVPADRVFELGPDPAPGSILLGSQAIHAAIDAGIARAAFDEGLIFLSQNARPPLGSGVDRATSDPLVIVHVGQLATRLRAVEALFAAALVAVDAADDDKPDSVFDAKLAVAAAKTQAGEAALSISSEIFSLSGTRSALEIHGLDRHWRNARIHTLHSPHRWTYFHLGNWVLNGQAPPPMALF